MGDWKVVGNSRRKKSGYRKQTVAEGYALLFLYIVPSPFFLVAPWVLR